MKTHDFIEKKTKRNKFGAKKCTIDGFTFDSLKEAATYQEYKLEQSQGYIRELTVHPKYAIHINNELICNVELDFTFFDVRQDKYRYIDVKAWDKKKCKYLVTSESRLKKKMIEASYPIEVEYV